MRKFQLIGIFLLLFGINYGQESVHIDYIRAHAKLAVEEMHLYKIPASITLSQGILETGGGQSRLAELANNHFGIKCKSQKEWSGPTISHTDDFPNECFRKYSNVQESYRDHSLFLAERPYYKALFTLNMFDYKAWAHGLRKAGYATNPRYGNILISSIERYKLDQFDKLTPDQVEMKLIELYGASDIALLTGVVEVDPIVQVEPEKEIIIAAATPEPTNTVQDDKPIRKVEVQERAMNPITRIKNHAVGVQYVVVQEGETFESIARLYDFKAKELAKFNELTINAKLTPGQNVFLSKKKKKGAVKTYKVQTGDNMYLIAQKTGMRINNLLKLNKLKPGAQPKVGTVLNLQKRKR